MICPHCQAETKEYPFCPYCGHRLSESDSPAPQDESQIKQGIFGRRWLLSLSILVVVIAFGILAMALVGFRKGVQDRELASQHQAEVLYNRGEVYLQCGQYQLAEAHFQEALRLRPSMADAAEQLSVARAKQTVTPSPTPPPPTSTPVVPTPTPEVVIVPVTDVLYQEGDEHYQRGEWESAIAKLEQLRLKDIDYKTDDVVEMLFESYKALGIVLDQEGQIEAAILQYDRALDLRPRNPEVSELRRRADLYQSALNDWDVDWESVINFLIALYHLAPEYQDTAERLYEACLIYGEELIKQERYCPASEIFEQAVEIRDDDQDIVKRETDTEYLCRVTAPPLLETPPPDGASSEWSQVHIGTLIATCHDPHNDRYDICAQNAKDNLLSTWITRAEQPAITLDGSLLAYRSSDPERPGLYALDVISGTQLTITLEADVHYPTWSPDGTQIAYTQYDDKKEDWFIYIASPGTAAAPRRIRQGEWPNWGPNGLLALTTCAGQNDCGIYIYDPTTETLQRLTASKQDRAAAWSPSGEEIAYMSDVGLSFNLYVATIQSGGVRQITKNLFTDVLPIWSPDGQRIAFVTNHNDNWSVYSVHPWPGQGQAEPIANLGAESADWQRFQLAWTASVVSPPGE